ncbi:hypothetical protein GQ53DRAFT_742467 [Thozetella sp. PMI_491]|nr:hypothetical protein GQ53DRAFT_742467 [Thozetella sp. PMI_491]
MATLATAAYVGRQLCDGKSTDATSFDSVSAGLDRLNTTHDRLWLILQTPMDGQVCADWAKEKLATTFSIDALGRSDLLTPDINTTCRGTEEGADQSLQHYLAADVGAFRAFSTFHIVVRVLGTSSEEERCFRADITPELPAIAQAIIRYGALCIFLFLCVVGILRTLLEKRTLTDEAGVDHILPRPILPGVGDCLLYLQFAFLTGSLSVQYPGFYQPAVALINWSALFTGSFVTHKYAYTSGRDGIYELNSTHDGLSGMSTMIEVLGTSSTVDLWINMLVIIAIIAILTFGGLTVFRLFNQRHNTQRDEMVSAATVSRMKQTPSQVLLVLISYFGLPMVALSFYQFSSAAARPISLTVLAAVQIVAIIAVFAWLLRQFPARRARILIFDHSKRYTYRLQAETGDSYKRYGVFLVVLFVLVFVRGAAIGGLQISGIGQLAVVGTCEVVLIASIASFQAYSTFSIGTIASAAQLLSLAAQITFLPGVAASDNAKSVVGYAILALHFCFLVLGCFVPAAYHLVQLYSRHWHHGPSPDVYGLRQLHRRESRATNLSSLGFAPPPGLDTIHESPSVQNRAHSPANRHSASNRASSTTSSSYYRPPRSMSYTGLREASQRRDSPSAAAISPVPPSRRRSLAASSAGQSFSTQSVSSSSAYSGSTGSWPSRSSQQAPLLKSPSEARKGRLGPRWDDYSFREADLFYAAPGPARRTDSPNPHLPGEQRAQQLAQESSRTQSTSRVSLRTLSTGRWSIISGGSGKSSRDSWISKRPEERGFHVVRPNRG